MKYWKIERKGEWNSTTSVLVAAQAVLFCEDNSPPFGTIDGNINLELALQHQT